MDVSLIWQIFITGIAILVVAIGVNSIAHIAGLATWYGFIDTINKNGLMNSLKTESVISLLFLFLLYPYILGLTGYYITKWFLK